MGLMEQRYGRGNDRLLRKFVYVKPLPGVG